MPVDIETKPIEDTISKVDGEFAVGSDLEFQRRWWRFERILWIVFTAILVLDVLGFFGRGWFAKGHAESADGTMRIDYERIERYGAPSMLTIHFGTNAVRDGRIQMWASDSLLHELGNQRVIPQPDQSALAWPGIAYSYVSSPTPNSVQFSLQPSEIGVEYLTLRVQGADPVRLRIVVFP